MRSFFSLFAFLVFFVAGSSLALAGNSKMENVDLDEDATVLVKADLDQDDLYYYIDKTACNCFLRVADKHFSGLSPVNCWSLRKHEKLKAHVSQCKEETPKVELSAASVQAIAEAYRSIASTNAGATLGETGSPNESEDAKDEDKEDED